MKTKPTKYTQKFVEKELKDMLVEIKNNEDIIYKGQLFDNRDYSYQRFSEWANKFKRNNKISDTIKRIDKILETRVNVGGLRSKLNATMVIFNLKNNYGWEDTRKMDVTGLSGLFQEISQENESLVKNDGTRTTAEHKEEGMEIE
jgi:hypothetical protein